MGLKLTNNSPFKAVLFEQINVNGELVTTLAVRGTFDLDAHFGLRLSSVQEDIVWADEYDGDPQTGNLIRTADFVAFKPGTDITVCGHSYAPKARAAQSWLTGVRVCDAEGAILKENILQVHGERLWLEDKQAAHARNAKNQVDADQTYWHLGAAQPARKVPLSWKLSAGGRIVSPQSPEGFTFDPYNPAGVSMPMVAEVERHVRAAPQFEPASQTISDANERPNAINLAPIPPFWRFRQQFSGTYDEAWKQQRFPLLPLDFDYRFYQCAHPSLVAIPWLAGNETVKLLNLHAEAELVEFVLPNIRLQMTCGASQVLNLDGVHINLDAASGQVVLTWRIGFFAAAGQDNVLLDMLENEADLAEAHLAASHSPVSNDIDWSAEA